MDENTTTDNGEFVTVKVEITAVAPARYFENIADAGDKMRHALLHSVGHGDHELFPGESINVVEVTKGAPSPELSEAYAAYEAAQAQEQGDLLKILGLTEAPEAAPVI